MTRDRSAEEEEPMSWLAFMQMVFLGAKLFKLLAKMVLTIKNIRCVGHADYFLLKMTSAW